MARRLVAIVAILARTLSAVAAEAAIATPKCLVAKRKACATRRKCEAAEERSGQQKPADLVKCAAKPFCRPPLNCPGA